MGKPHLGSLKAAFTAKIFFILGSHQASDCVKKDLKQVMNMKQKDSSLIFETTTTIQNQEQLGSFKSPLTDWHMAPNNIIAPENNH